MREQKTIRPAERADGYITSLGDFQGKKGKMVIKIIRKHYSTTLFRKSATEDSPCNKQENEISRFQAPLSRETRAEGVAPTSLRRLKDKSRANYGLIFTYSVKHFGAKRRLRRAGQKRDLKLINNLISKGEIN
jgi:hypothetical protein